MPDLHKPSEIAVLVESAGVAKARANIGNLLVLGALAGAFIAFGAAFYTITMTGVEPGYGPARVLGGLTSRSGSFWSLSAARNCLPEMR